MITFLSWLWPPASGYRTTFTAAHVNTWARMIRRHYDGPHRILCCTNMADGIDESIEIVPDRCDFANVPSPHGAAHPSCFRRLRLYSPDAALDFGERIVSMDLDCVITGPLAPLFDRPEDWIGWRDPCRPAGYCGSLTMLTAGSRPSVWSGFDETMPQEALRNGWRGSDQAWVSYALGPGEAQFTREHGVYSFRFDLDMGRRELPGNAVVVFFTGKGKAWEPEQQRLEWVRRHYV